MLRFLCAMAALGLALRAAAAPALTVVTEDFAPYSYQQDGKISGYATDVVRELLARARLDYDLGMYPWARAYLIAKSRPNVLIYSIVRTPEREAQFQWIAQLAPRSVYVYKLAARSDIQLKSVADLRAYRIGANRGDIVEEQLRLLGLQADLAAQDEFSLRKLLAGRVDVMVASEPMIKPLCASLGVPLSTLERTMVIPGVSSYYLAASKGTPAATVRLLRAEFDKLKNTDFLQRTAANYALTLR